MVPMAGKSVLLLRRINKGTCQLGTSVISDSKLPVTFLATEAGLPLSPGAVCRGGVGAPICGPQSWANPQESRPFPQSLLLASKKGKLISELSSKLLPAGAQQCNAVNPLPTPSSTHGIVSTQKEKTNKTKHLTMILLSQTHSAWEVLICA